MPSMKTMKQFNKLNDIIKKIQDRGFFPEKELKIFMSILSNIYLRLDKLDKLEAKD